MIKSSGEFNTKIRIQQKVALGSGLNKTISWVDIGNTAESDPPKWIYAKWENVHGSEAWQAQSVQASRAATVSVWYKPEITEKCRVIDDVGIVFEIVSLDDVKQKHIQVEMKVKAGVMG